MHQILCKQARYVKDVRKPGEGQLALAEDAGDGELPLLLDLHHGLGLGSHHREKGPRVTDKSLGCPTSLCCEQRQTGDQLTGGRLKHEEKTFSFLEVALDVQLEPTWPELLVN